MASLAELARIHTDLDGPRIAHLQRLVAAWGLLADFSFADLLLFAPTREGDGREFAVLAQIRPTTAQTVYRRDWVGSVLPADGRDIVARSWASGDLLEGELQVEPLRERCARARHPGAVRGQLRRRPHEGVDSDGRPADRGARAPLRRGVQPLRPDDRQRRVPVPQRGRRHRRHAPSRRRRSGARCATASRVLLAERRVGAAQDRCARQRRGDASRRARSRRDADPAGLRGADPA